MKRRQRRSPSRRSLCLAHPATIWDSTATTETIRRSARIAAIRLVVRDYLLAQCKIIDVCCRALGSGFKVHAPRRGTPGSLSHIKLATFTRFTHTVYGFSLGKQGGIWLHRDNESGRYCFGYPTWGYLPGSVLGACLGHGGA